jgi:hypothetical protein
MKRAKRKGSMPTSQSRILESVHRSAKGLYKAGLMSESTMQEFDALCLESANIKQIRSNADYERALARFDELLHENIDSEQGDELDNLAVLIEAYEKKIF